MVRLSQTACCGVIEGPTTLRRVFSSRTSPVAVIGGNFKPAPPFFFLSLFSLSSLSSLSPERWPLASLPSSSSKPPLVPEAGPRRPPRLLLTLNRVDFILALFIDYVRDFMIF
jgi:hypothetical protein